VDVWIHIFLTSALVGGESRWGILSLCKWMATSYHILDIRMHIQGVLRNTLYRNEAQFFTLTLYLLLVFCRPLQED
jgi:hypothetical protein